MAETKFAPPERSLYEQDFFVWSQQQAAALRAVAAGGNTPLDYANLAEEIESLGKRDRREVQARIGTIIEHLLKLEFSPSRQPRNGWLSTVARERRELELVLADSPSLAVNLTETIRAAAVRSGRDVVSDLETRGETEPARAVGRLAPWDRYDQDRVLGDWWPDPPSQEDQPGSV